MYLQTLNIKSLDLSKECVIKTCMPITISVQQIGDIYLFKANKNKIAFVKYFDDIDCLICFLEEIKSCGVRRYFSRKNYSYFF